MKLPIGLFTALGKNGYTLYCYLYKGAKIDAALNFVQSRQTPKGPSNRNPSDRPIFVGDAINIFDFMSEYSLTIKNASKNPAYNIKLVNQKDIFSWTEELPPLASLEPGESFSILCRFHTLGLHLKSGGSREKYLRIPEDRVDKELVISYQNDARTTLYTKFKVNEREALNKYTLKP